MQPRAVGVVTVNFGLIPLDESAARAVECGFDHIDITWPQMQEIEERGEAAVASLPVPIVDRICMPEFVVGCTALAPWEAPGEDRFDETVAIFRSNPGVRLEPVGGTAAGSSERLEALLEAVPGLRLTLDTGHITTWGGDPIPFLRHADHVQLRQASPGQPQVHPDDGGDVDFADVLSELDRLDYPGVLSVEYFDQPGFGMPLDDPEGHAVALAKHVRSLMS